MSGHSAKRERISNLSTSMAEIGCLPINWSIVFRLLCKGTFLKFVRSFNALSKIIAIACSQMLEIVLSSLGSVRRMSSNSLSIWLARVTWSGVCGREVDRLVCMKESSLLLEGVLDWCVRVPRVLALPLSDCWVRGRDACELVC